jgi:hypothetical protein
MAALIIGENMPELKMRGGKIGEKPEIRRKKPDRCHSIGRLPRQVIPPMRPAIG